jgi:hypothetical protein
MNDLDLITKLKNKFKVEKEEILNKQKAETRRLLETLPPERLVYLSPKQYKGAQKIAEGRYNSNRLNGVYHPNLDGKEIAHLDKPWEERDLVGALGEVIALNWLHSNFEYLNTMENSFHEMTDFSPRSSRQGTDDGDLWITLPNGQRLSIDVKCTTYEKNTSIPAWKKGDLNIDIIMRVSLIDKENGIGFIQGFIKTDKSYQPQFWNKNAATPCWSIPHSQLTTDFPYFINTHFNSSIQLH